MKTKVSSNQKITVEVSGKQNARKTISVVKKQTNVKFIQRKKEMFGERNDLLTGEVFIPLRRNQKFATSKNRTEYHNNLQNERVSVIVKSVAYNQQRALWNNVLRCIDENCHKSQKTILDLLMREYKVTLK